MEQGISDVVKVKKALAGIKDVNLEAIHIRRFNKATRHNQHPPIVVTFETKHDAAAVLAGWKSLPAGIQMGADLTKTQLDHFKKLKNIAYAHNAANPLTRKAVRIIEGEPTLIDYKQDKTDTATSSTSDMAHSATQAISSI